MEPHDVLGVPMDATDDEIVKAHRSKMQANHPDRGGDTVHAAELNKARDIMLGKEQPGPDPVRERLLHMFATMVDKEVTGDLVQVAKNSASAVIQNQGLIVARLSKRLDNLSTQVGRITRDNGASAYDLVVTQKIEHLKQEIAAANKELSLAEKVLAELEHYEDTRPSEPTVWQMR